MCPNYWESRRANWALGTQHSWEGWKLPTKVRETLLSSALEALRAEKGAPTRSWESDLSPDFKKTRLFLSVLKKKKNQIRFPLLEWDLLPQMEGCSSPPPLPAQALTVFN